jgi:hypothetical protein
VNPVPVIGDRESNKLIRKPNKRSPIDFQDELKRTFEEKGLDLEDSQFADIKQG